VLLFLFAVDVTTKITQQSATVTDLYEVKTSFEEGEHSRKVSALAQKRWTVRQQVKAIQEAAISQFSLSLSESEETINTARDPKQVKTDLGEKRSGRSLRSTFNSMCEVIEQHQSIAVQELMLKKELLQEQMLLKKAQVEAQLKMIEEKHQLELQHKKQQLQMNEKVMAMMELMIKKKCVNIHVCHHPPQNPSYICPNCQHFLCYPPPLH
jgi:hypothetical protein